MPDTRPRTPSADDDRSEAPKNLKIIRTLDGHGHFGDEEMRRNAYDPDAPSLDDY